MIRWSVSRKKNKESVKEIIIDENNPKWELEGGVLDLKEYVNLEKLMIDGQYLKSKLTKLEVINCSKLAEIYLIYSDLDNLDVSCNPNLTSLRCSFSQLTVLDLSRNPNLTFLDCRNNQIANLKISNHSQIRFFYCLGNLLTDLNFLDSLSSNHLSMLYIGNNNFPEQNLSCFRKFTNLVFFSLGDNNFTGNLGYLKDLNKLYHLEIDDTDIDSGLEYLPYSIKSFNCSTKKRPESRVKKIELELSKFGLPSGDNFSKLLSEWRKVNPEKISAVQQTQELKRLLEQLDLSQEPFHNQVPHDKREIELEKPFRSAEKLQITDRLQENLKDQEILIDQQLQDKLRNENNGLKRQLQNYIKQRNLEETIREKAEEEIKGIKKASLTST